MKVREQTAKRKTAIAVHNISTNEPIFEDTKRWKNNVHHVKPSMNLFFRNNIRRERCCDDGHP